MPASETFASLSWLIAEHEEVRAMGVDEKLSPQLLPLPVNAAWMTAGLVRSAQVSPISGPRPRSPAGATPPACPSHPGGCAHLH
jgi:hypothetical protein